MIDINSIDWDKIAESLPKRKDNRISMAPLATKDFYFEKVYVVAANRSIAQDLLSLVTAQLRRHEHDRLQTIAFEARQRGMSFEDYFIAAALDKLD